MEETNRQLLNRITGSRGKWKWRGVRRLILCLLALAFLWAVVVLPLYWILK